MSKQQKLRGLLVSAQHLCEQLEMGQAETPLMDRFAGQLQDLDSAPLTAVLVAMTPESLEQTLKWLYGDVFKAFTVSTLEWPRFMEISITNEGYGFGLLRERKRTFAEQEAFVDALRIEFGATRASLSNPLSLQLTNSRGVAGLKLLVPESPDTVVENPDVLNAIVSQANFAMLAAPLNYTLSREDHEAVEMLTSNMRCFWPLLSVDELSEGVALPEVGWWEQHSHGTVNLPPKLITRHVEASLPGILTDKDNADRQWLINGLHARKLSGNLEAIFGRYQQQAAVLEQQVARATSAIRNTGPSKPLQRDGDQLRQRIDDSLMSARKDLLAFLQELTLPNSPLIQAAQPAVANLQFDNLDAERGHSTYKLTLSENYVNQLRTMLVRQSKAELAASVDRCNNHLATIQKYVDEQLKALGIKPMGTLENLDVLSMQQDLERRVELTISYRGEMSRRTLMTRLGESRRLIMGLSMTAMVLGGVAKGLLNIDLRSSLMTIAPVILIGGFIYTYFQWPKEDAEKLDKELDRIRDSLNSEIKRVASDVQRFAQQQVTEVLETHGKNLQKHVQQILAEHREKEIKQEDNRRDGQQKRLQQLERELQQWQGTKRRLEQLKADAAELDRSFSSVSAPS